MTEELITPEAPQWGDLCLRFADKDEATAVLEGYDGNIDTIGIIYKPTGRLLEESPEMAPLTGWHVNVRGALLEKLLLYAVQVDTPFRVWA
jgi:hypothetical protein